MQMTDKLSLYDTAVLTDSQGEIMLFLFFRSETVGKCPVLSRTDISEYDHSDAEKYEWNAQHLSHIHTI